MDLSLLATLKQKLVEAKDLSDVMTYFFDHFADHVEFLDLGEPTREPFLEGAIHDVAAQLFNAINEKVVLIEMRLVLLPEHQFIHGSVELSRKPGTVLYFQDIHAGMLAVLWSVHPPETKFCRFRGRPAVEKHAVSRN